MKNEIATAVVFITSMVKNKAKLTKEQLNTFSDKLTVALAVKYRNHWYEESPSRGQAYRCLRISPNAQEPLLKRVASNSKIGYSELCLPKDMILWVDPGEVSCRFGDRGSTFLVSSFKKPVASDERNPDNRNNQTQNNARENVYRYTKYSKQQMNITKQYQMQNIYQETNWNHNNQYQPQEFYQDQYQSGQDRYHWHNIYNTQPLAVV